MSLSVTALLAAAIDVDPDAVVEVDGGPGLTVRELDRRSRALAGALLATGVLAGTTVRVPSDPGHRRAVGLLAAWRVGCVVTADATTQLDEPTEAPPTADVENLLAVAESRVWSQTPAAVTPAGTTLTHADLVDHLNHGAGAADLVRSLTRLRVEQEAGDRPSVAVPSAGTTDPPPPTIRPAATRDAAAVFELACLLALTFEVDHDAFTRAYDAILGSPDAHLLVADLSGDVVGYLLGFDHPSFFANGPIAWVEEIAVLPEHRRHNVGSRLMAAFEDRMRERGGRLVALATTRADTFYKAVGYSRHAAYFRKIL